MASGLSGKVVMIENSIALLGMLYDRLKYLQPTTSALIEAAAGMEQFSRTEFLIHCRDEMRRGIPFPEAWRSGIEEHAKLLGKEHAQALLPLGGTLGSTDLESQLTAIDYTRQLLNNRLEIARDYRDKHAKLYRSLGALCGVAIAIILF